MYTDMQSISVVLKIIPSQILFHSCFSSAIPPSPLPSFIPFLFYLFPASSFPFLFLTLFHSFPPSYLSSFIPLLLHLFPSFIPLLLHTSPPSSLSLLHTSPPSSLSSFIPFLFHPISLSSLSSFISSRNLFLPSILSLVHPSSPYSLLLSPLPPRTLSCSEILNQRRCLVWQGVRRSSPRPRTPDTATALN